MIIAYFYTFAHDMSSRPVLKALRNPTYCMAAPVQEFHKKMIAMDDRVEKVLDMKNLCNVAARVGKATLLLLQQWQAHHASKTVDLLSLQTATMPKTANMKPCQHSVLYPFFLALVTDSVEVLQRQSRKEKKLKSFLPG